MTAEETLPQSHPLPIAVDVMGGDLGSQPVILGAIQAATEFNIHVLLVGNTAEIEPLVKALPSYVRSLIQIEHAPDVITMEDSPSKAIRGKGSCSIRVAYELAQSGRAAAVVSTGNTGAFMAAGLYVSGTLSGIARPAIATLLPQTGDAYPTVLLDAGANVDCHAHQLVQFALMGSAYAAAVFNKKSPRVALLSNGSEASKGTDTLRATALILKEISELNFIGYVEGRDLSRDCADVVVCDGFLGNVVLKTIEGAAKLVIDSIKLQAQKSLLTKIGMLCARNGLRRLFEGKLDPSAYGGAPLLGLNHLAIVCHGSSNAKAVMNAVRNARKLYDGGLIQEMETALSAARVLQADVSQNL